jgi:hypothetical protein
LFIYFLQRFFIDLKSVNNNNIKSEKNKSIIHRNKKLGLKDLLFRNNSSSNIENDENTDKNVTTKSFYQKDKDNKEFKKIASEPQFIKNDKELSEQNKVEEKNKEEEEEKRELEKNNLLNNDNNDMNEKNFLAKECNDVMDKKNEKVESISHNKSSSFIENNMRNINQKNKNRNFFNKNISSINFFSKNNIMGFNFKNRNKLQINSGNKIIYNLNKEQTHNTVKHRVSLIL